MAILQFASLRSKNGNSDRVYTVTIGGVTLSEPLTAADEPFVTEEDSDEDMFCPIRTQSGYVRILADLNGAWKAVLPQTDMDRPVTLTHLEGSTQVVDWQGYLQAENFGTDLYGYREEVELPVQCGLTVLQTKQVPVSETQLSGLWGLHNFAWLLQYLIGQTGLTWNTLYVQGGAMARDILLKKFNWSNFVDENDDGDNEPRYSLYEVLEDICRFWGWTARTCGQEIYLTSADENSDFLRLRYLNSPSSELATIASEASGASSAGTVVTYDTAQLTGDIFATADNDDMLLRGVSKATVKADIDEQDTIVQFADATIRNTLKNASLGWEWHQGDGDMVGYFETYFNASNHNIPYQGVLQSSKMKLTAFQGSVENKYNGFARRQIYQSSESENAQESDVIIINYKNADWNPEGADYVTYIQMDTKRAMAYSGGSLRLTGNVWQGGEKYNEANEIVMRLGVGMSRSSAQWWSMKMREYTDQSGQITCGWQASPAAFYVPIRNGRLYTSGEYFQVGTAWVRWFLADRIPMPAAAYGYIFVDICGSGLDSLQLGDFAIEFYRDGVQMPATVNTQRARVMVTDGRESSREYVAQNVNKCQDEWNADCIFGSDNNMEYGYGLLMNADGTYMGKLNYGGTEDEYPEQHLAYRVATYWATSRRMVTAEMRTDNSTVAGVTPKTKCTVNGGAFSSGTMTMYPVAISHKWRDDVTVLTMIEI